MNDKNYWNSYYEAHLPNTEDASPFAKAMFEKYMRSGDTLIDLGCGNGRDSLYFANQGLSVIGIDSADVAITELNNSVSMSNVSFICGDFCSLNDIADDSFDFCYSRFTVHAVTLEQEMEMLKNVKRVLRPNGKFLVEVRSVHDGICGLGQMTGGGVYL